MMCSYATSSCLISFLSVYSVEVIWFITAFKLFITVRISGITSTFVFSIRTPLTNRQHLRVSSSLEMLSMTNSFSRFSSSNSTSFCTRTCASWLSYLYRIATFCCICSSVRPVLGCSTPYVLPAALPAAPADESIWLPPSVVLFSVELPVWLLSIFLIKVIYKNWIIQITLGSL